MKKLLSLIAVLVLSSISVLSSVACDSRTYFDDRTPIQLAEAKFILGPDLKLNLNPNKHVLLIGLDGIPLDNLDEDMINASSFRANYYNQAYETIKGWTSILWGNILQTEKNIFHIIKDNDPSFKTANITQWMGPYYYGHIYGPDSFKYIDYNRDFDSESGLENYDTIEKMQSQLAKLKDETEAKVKENYNFIFAYNTYFDELKHKHYVDEHELVIALIETFKDFVTYFYNTLNKDDWLIIVTTDHGRENTNNGFNHSDVLSAHFSWTLSNHILSEILERAYTNFYDIRTVVIEWLMNK